MNRGNLVRKYIGEALAPFKFEYCGYQGDCWVFEKKFGRITQTICISPYRFDANMMTFELYTDARETGLVQAADIEGIESDNYEHGYWKYADNEESLRKVLNQMKEVLIKKGMKILKDLSVEPEIVITNEMYHELYINHKQLSEDFIEKTHVEVTGFDSENINRWFDVMDKRLADLHQYKYEEIKDKLVEMAAFIGSQLEKYMGGKWDQHIHKDYESCIVYKIKSSRVTSINCMGIIVGGYEDGTMNWPRSILLEVYETRTN